MNVLMTADAVGGVWRYALALTRALGPLGVDVTLAVTGPAPSRAQHDAALAAGARAVHHGRFRLEWMPEAGDDVDAARTWLHDLVERTAPDVVHVNGYSDARGAWDAPTVCVAHSCVVTWWHAVHGDDPPPEWDAYRARVADGLTAADAVVAPTAAFGHALARAHGAVAEAAVIPNAVHDPPAPAPRKEPFALATGRFWDEAKNLATLDAAAARARWPVRVVGDNQDPVTGQVAEAAHLTLLGRQPDDTLAALFGRAAVFAHPALYEPFGLAPLEAAHAGCALVLSDVPTLREVWGDAAVFVPPRDAEAYANALNALALDDAHRERLQARAAERARRYDPASFGRAYASLYARLTDDSSLTERLALTEEPPCAF